MQRQQMALLVLAKITYLHYYQNSCGWSIYFTPQTIRTRAHSEADRDPPFQAVSVWLFGPRQDSIDSFTPGQMKHINWTNIPRFTLAEPSRLGVKAP